MVRAPTSLRLTPRQAWCDEQGLNKTQAHSQSPPISEADVGISESWLLRVCPGSKHQEWNTDKETVAGLGGKSGCSYLATSSPEL